MLKNLALYRLNQVLPRNSMKIASILNEHLKPFQECSPMQKHSMGWIPVHEPGQDGQAVPAELAYALDAHVLLRFQKQTRSVPTSTIKKLAGQRAKDIEEQQGRKVGRKEMRELTEAAEQELLPKAFPKDKTAWVWIAPSANLLSVGATGALADEIIECLSGHLGDVPVALLRTAVNPVVAMTEWLVSGEPPERFSLDTECELRGIDRASIRYKGHDLGEKNLREYIAEGRQPFSLAMTFNDRVSFVLNDKGNIRRIAMLDIVKENDGAEPEGRHARQDADFLLFAGELTKLIDKLVVVLGGEQEPAQPTGQEPQAE